MAEKHSNAMKSAITMENELENNPLTIPRKIKAKEVPQYDEMK